VVTLSALTSAAVVTADLALNDSLSLFYDIAFVMLCAAAAFSVRPRDFFVVGVLPPLLMLATMLVLAPAHRAAVAEKVDGPAQAIVSGLAHHAGALVTGYGLVLGILTLRQVAARNAGRIRTFV
jgi:hypothetical protein